MQTYNTCLMHHDLPIRFRCNLCGFCCRFYTPLITARDVRRLQSLLRKPLSSFLVFYRPQDFTIPVQEDERFFATKHGYVAMGLRREAEDCVFLENNLCSIHSFKPGICRAFPFQPVAPGKIEGPYELLENPCDGNNTEDEIVSQESAGDAYKTFIQDYYAFVDHVKDWNTVPASWERDIEDFLQYVGLDWELYATQIDLSSYSSMLCERR